MNKCKKNTPLDAEKRRILPLSRGDYLDCDFKSPYRKLSAGI